MCNFASDSTSFSSGFPGVRPHLLTLTSNFTIPFYREILLLMGVCSVSKRSCERILRKGNGSAITIVVGGAAESLSAHPGTADLTLRRRCALYSILVDVDQTGVSSDWGSSNLQFGKGVSLTLLRTYSILMLTCVVRISYRCFRLARTMYVYLPAIDFGVPKMAIPDLPANAKRKGYIFIQDPEKIPKCLWFYPPIISWTRNTQLRVTEVISPHLTDLTPLQIIGAYFHTAGESSPLVSCRSLLSFMVKEGC